LAESDNLNSLLNQVMNNGNGTSDLTASTPAATATTGTATWLMLGIAAVVLFLFFRSSK
jgi:hypothetical protein